MLSYPSTISLSNQTLRYLTDLLRSHRSKLGCRWRKLSPGRQALLVLAHLRNGDTYHRLAAGFGIGVATVCRYIHEAITVLASLARSLQTALWHAGTRGSNYLVLDGTLVAMNRLRAFDRWYYSEKHRHHGLNHQGLIDDTGRLIWVSDGLPGSVHDLTAARTHQVLSTCQKVGVLLLADKGYHGPNCGAITPYKGASLPESYQVANRSHARVRGQGERGFAVLKNWHVLDKLRCCPLRAVHYPKAILTLELQS